MPPNPSTSPSGVAHLIDPELAAARAKLPNFDISLTTENLDTWRTVLATEIPYEASGEVTITERSVPGADGDPDVVLRIHTPTDSPGPLPCVYFMHGGGLVMGTARREDERFERYCTRFNCVGVSVEYRLAPETPYPGPLEDCYAGLRYVYQHADELGIDQARIGIGGTSAGAGLAAGLALLARDRNEMSVAFQLLIYPMIDDRLRSASSRWHDAPVWDPVSNRFGWESYLPGIAGTDDVPIYAAAARAADLSGLPATYIMVGTLDGFLDEDVDYAIRLAHAGVPTELHVYPGAIHGFDAFARSVAVARHAVDDIRRWLATQLAP
jgi:acetyl esterase/lipase